MSAWLGWHRRLGRSGDCYLPDHGFCRALGEALAGLPVGSVTEVDRLRADLAIADVLGPATLIYLDQREFSPVNPAVAVEQLLPQHRDLDALLADAEEYEAGESRISGILVQAECVTSPTEAAV